ncbi:alpha/beta hydrolase [Brachybacterium huguangmaarense]|uniref:Alpha/beta hydrolase n=1 Tax=Brachybacterium huguangmaarense TaxID=1652028 RepID=A0ABY6G4E1_9MICO|nr:alpha/beta hydrolase [Brachybacterium huguangmaarense]UYG18068.1 alpha/beta hydrolase [Brachybacterium huguangmaarense]
MDTRRPARLVTALAALTLALTGCSILPFGGTATSPSSDSSASDGGSGSGGDAGDGKLPEIGTSAAADLDGDPATDEKYSSYYSQQIDWQPCEDYTGARCGSITVPKAWNDPSKGDITLQMIDVPATGQKKGSLLMNPGGPGGGGVEFVGDSGTSIVSESVRENYDLIGFDPRGVGTSDPIRCLDDADTDEYLADTYDMLTPDGLSRGKEWMQRIADACEQNSGDLLGYMDTESAARDMDVMRSAVGSEKLDYLGFSYGTYLGATYADLYPSRTGKFILDGAIDPTLTGDEMVAGQAKGFEDAVHAFAQWCIDQGSDTCPLKGTVDEGVQQIRDFFAATDETPVATNDSARPLTGALARSGVLVGMYNDQNWSYVAQGLQGAMNGNGSLLLYLADLSSERGDDGHYTGNGTYSITAVNCLDHPAVEDETWMQEQAESLAETSPTFGGSMGFTGMACGLWPEGPVRKPAEIHAKGSDLIVVIGTTGDPATPYPWAQALAKQLDNSTLITWEGEGHTAYGRSGGCVEDAVDQYILDGTAPEKDLVCS